MPAQGATRAASLWTDGRFSRGGVSLRLLHAFPPGMALEITLHTPKGTLPAEGMIAWVAPPERRTPGQLIQHGLGFTALDWPPSLSLGLVAVESVEEALCQLGWAWNLVGDLAMPEGASHRRFPQSPIQPPLIYRLRIPASGYHVGVGWTRNLTESGTCIELAERLQPEVLVNVRLRADRGPIQAEGRVVWTGPPTPPSGGIPHGLAFTQITPDQSRAPRDLLLPLSMATHAGVRLPVDLPVRCRTKSPPGSTLQGRTGDMSRGGLQLLLPEALSPGPGLEATLHTAAGPLSVAGVIVWADPPERRRYGRSIRHGMQFTPLNWSISLYLGLLLAELA